MVKTCCISGCISGPLKDRGIRSSQNIKQASLFGIPEDATLLAQWSSILNMTLTKHNCICDYHFKEEDIVKSRKIDYSSGIIKEYELKRWTLLPNAVPVNLQPRQYDIELSENQENLHYQTVKIINDDKFSKKPTINVRKPFQQLDNVETRFDAEQVFLNEIDSNNTPKNIKELLDSSGQKEASDNDSSKDLNRIDLPKTVRENEDKLIDHDYNVTYTSEQVLAYLAGYVSRKMKKKYEFCKNCFDSLSSAGSVEENQQNELINELSLYGGLAYPNQGLFELTRRLENTVLNVVGKKGIEGNTIQMIFDRITQIQLPKIGCHEHSLLLTREIIIYYLTMRGHFLAKTFNKEYIEKKNKSKMYKKLSKL